VTSGALEAKLVTYRDMMITDVTNAHVANPAIARRYQMMNRATYQTNIGQ
jgi:hypothetical protein